MAETKTEEESEARAAILRQMKKTYPKLVLWHTKDCKPLFTHDHLSPVMETLVASSLFCFLRPRILSLVASKSPGWSTSTAATPPSPPRQVPSAAIHFLPFRHLLLYTPKLSYPYIDGLHLYTYRAFLDAVNVYIDNRFSDKIFHLQGIPANLDDTELDSWYYVQESKTLVRKGTLDPALEDIYSNDDTIE